MVNFMLLSEYMKDEKAKSKHHFERLDKHVGLVKKYGRQIAGLKLPGIDQLELIKEVDAHDMSKRSEPELTPYKDISWYYKLKKDGHEMELTKEMENAMAEATLHHIKNNKHHPDYWSDEVSKEELTMKNRIENPKDAIDAFKMPKLHMAHMVADWLAMSEEVGGTAKAWADKTINKRWNFNDDQTKFIYNVIDLIESP